MESMETIFSKSKMTSKGQLTLPKKVRTYLDAKIGDNIIFELKNEQLVIRKYEGIEKYFGTLSEFNDSGGESLKK